MLWSCDTCTTLYAVGLPGCPHCGSTEYTEVGGVPPAGPQPPASGRRAARSSSAAAS